MFRIATFAAFVTWMLVPQLGFATDLGPPAAGFDGSGFTLRPTIKGTTSMYSLTRDDDPTGPGYRASFATGGVEGAFGVQDRVRIVANIGVGGFNGYNQPLGGPDGTYKVYGGGARVTVLRMKAAPVELGGGLNLSWWERQGAVAAGEWTLLAGGAVRVVPGHVLYGGGQYFTVGGTQRVMAQIDTAEVALHGEGMAIYGGYEARLAFLSARIEVRAEAPTFHRTGYGFSLGLEF